MIKAMASAPVQRTQSLKKINDGVAEEEEEEEDDTSATSEAGDDTSQAQEEEDKDEDEDEGEGENEDVDDVDQVEINRIWIKGLDVNYPLKTYYKYIKKNLLILMVLVLMKFVNNSHYILRSYLYHI